MRDLIQEEISDISGAGRSARGGIGFGWETVYVSGNDDGGGGSSSGGGNAGGGNNGGGSNLAGEVNRDVSILTGAAMSALGAHPVVAATIAIGTHLLIPDSKAGWIEFGKESYNEGRHRKNP